MSSDPSNDPILENIPRIEFPESIRKRPGMYIGDVGFSGLHYLLYSLVFRSLEDVAQGNAHAIQVSLYADGSAKIVDDGPGIPVTPSPSQCPPTLEEVFTSFLGLGRDHQGKFWLPLACTNALSEWLHVETRHNGQIYRQEYERGQPIADVRLLGTCSDSGVRVRFKPDPIIFTEVNFSYPALRDRFRELAFLHSGLHIAISDQATDAEEHFEFEDGIRAFLQELNRDRRPLHAEALVLRGEEEGVGFEIGLQFCQEPAEKLLAFVNGHATRASDNLGTHVLGFRAGLSKALNSFARNCGLAQGRRPKVTELLRGLTAVVSVRLDEPMFAGGTKIKLLNEEVGRVVEKNVGRSLEQFLTANPRLGEEIVQLVIFGKDLS